jgi:hypothetical protein
MCRFVLTLDLDLIISSLIGINLVVSPMHIPPLSTACPPSIHSSTAVLLKIMPTPPEHLLHVLLSGQWCINFVPCFKAGMKSPVSHILCTQ